MDFIFRAEERYFLSVSPEFSAAKLIPGQKTCYPLAR